MINPPKTLGVWISCFSNTHMFRFRAICSHRFQRLPKTTIHPSPILQRSISAFPPIEDQAKGDNAQKGKKPLVDLFKETVGLHEKLESESEGESNELKKKLRNLEREVRRLKSNTVTESETPKKKKKEKELKKEGVSKEQTNPKTNSLSSLFSDGKRRESGSLEKEEREGEEEPAVLKDLSEDMLLLLSHFHREGYFKDANFLPRSGLIYGAFNDSYSRSFINFAAEKFGRDNQEIAK